MKKKQKLPLRLTCTPIIDTETHRCQHSFDNGACELPDQFVCPYYLLFAKQNPEKVGPIPSYLIDQVKKHNVALDLVQLLPKPKKEPAFRSASISPMFPPIKVVDPNKKLEFAADEETEEEKPKPKTKPRRAAAFDPQGSLF